MACFNDDEERERERERERLGGDERVDPRE